MVFEVDAGAVDYAAVLIDAGQSAAAKAVLAEALPPKPPAVQDSNPVVMRAAALYAVVLGRDPAAERWATHAFEVSQRLPEPDALPALAARGALAGVLYRAGQLDRCIQLFQGLVEGLQRRVGPDGSAALIARADLALAQHVNGRCAAARTEMSTVLAAYRRHHPHDHRTHVRMLLTLAQMQRRCQADPDAVQSFVAAVTLAHQHLPTGDPLIRQATRLARTPGGPPCRQCRDGATAGSYLYGDADGGVTR
ncbi:hypothetical protein Prum_069180 [Phytohabitans rumicis]|uniref:MalT-like TPR region domain-containing protein n=2 Tax=Phytohabitans rumicis TaxID=1076125 RepID=A0A6V8LGN6_9ACTN|nr:hypothetical protein Prum_069180 [Phytohabitans rumicis]